MKKLSHEDYMLGLKSKGINIQPLEDYNGLKTKILHKCLCGKIWNTRPMQVLEGQNCKDCAVIIQTKSITKSQEKYLEELKERQSNFLPMEPYRGLNSKIEHKCQCGETEKITPRVAKNKIECNICKEKPVDDYTYLRIIENKNIKVKPLESFKGAKTPILHKCSCGNEWNSRPFQILKGSLCKCNRTSFRTGKFYKDKKTILYYLRIENSFKIGICLLRGDPIKDIRTRYNKDKHLKIEIINYICFNDGELAYNREQEIVKNNKYNLALPILATGNSELFDTINFL